MNHVYQPLGSSLCGQACVAMVANISLAEAIRAFGGKQGGTRTKEVVEALNRLGIMCGDRLHHAKESLPDVCIVKLRFSCSHRSHWTLWYHGRFYDPDPAGDEALNTDKTKYPPEVRVSSYLSIFGVEQCRSA